MGRGPRGGPAVRRPLAGRRVVITRPRERAGELARRLEALGAEVILFPVLRCRPVRSGPLRVDGFTHLAFTSRTAVDLFFRRLGRDRGNLRRLRICAVGERTAAALRDHGVRPFLVAREFTTRGLARELCRRGVRGARILHPAADRSDPAFERVLRRHGARVTRRVLYRIEGVRPRGAEAVRKADWILFASAQTVRNFMKAMGGRPGRARAACLGPVTALAARRCGLRVGAVPRRCTLEDLVREIARKA